MAGRRIGAALAIGLALVTGTASADSLDRAIEGIAAEIAPLLNDESFEQGGTVALYLIPPQDVATGRACAALTQTLRHRMGAALGKALQVHRRRVAEITARQSVGNGDLALRLDWVERHGALELRPQYGRMAGGNVVNEVFSAARVELGDLSGPERACIRRRGADDARPVNPPGPGGGTTPNQGGDEAPSIPGFIGEGESL